MLESYVLPKSTLNPKRRMFRKVVVFWLTYNIKQLFKKFNCVNVECTVQNISKESLLAIIEHRFSEFCRHYTKQFLFLCLLNGNAVVMNCKYGNFVSSFKLYMLFSFTIHIHCNLLKTSQTNRQSCYRHMTHTCRNYIHPPNAWAWALSAPLLSSLCSSTLWKPVIVVIFSES